MTARGRPQGGDDRRLERFVPLGASPVTPWVGCARTARKPATP